MKKYSILRALRVVVFYVSLVAAFGGCANLGLNREAVRFFVNSVIDASFDMGDEPTQFKYFIAAKILQCGLEVSWRFMHEK